MIVMLSCSRTNSSSYLDTHTFDLAPVAVESSQPMHTQIMNYYPSYLVIGFDSKRGQYFKSNCHYLEQIEWFDSDVSEVHTEISCSLEEPIIDTSSYTLEQHIRMQAREMGLVLLSINQEQIAVHEKEYGGFKKKSSQ